MLAFNSNYRNSYSVNFVHLTINITLIVNSFTFIIPNGVKCQRAENMLEWLEVWLDFRDDKNSCMSAVLLLVLLRFQLLNGRSISNDF